MSSLTILGDTSGSVLLQAPAVAGSPTVTLPSSTGTLITTAINSATSATGIASNVASNTASNCATGLSLPNNALIIVNMTISTSGGSQPSTPCYVWWITDGSTHLADSGAVGPYPQNGYSYIYNCLSYFNTSGSTKTLSIVAYPYASANYNTPTYTANYTIIGLK